MAIGLESLRSFDKLHTFWVCYSPPDGDQRYPSDVFFISFFLRWLRAHGLVWYPTVGAEAQLHGRAHCMKFPVCAMYTVCQLMNECIVTQFLLRHGVCGMTWMNVHPSFLIRSMGGGDDPFPSISNSGPNWHCWSENADFQLMNCTSTSPVWAERHHTGAQYSPTE